MRVRKIKHQTIGICDCCQEEITPSMRWVENDDGVMVCGCCLDDFIVDDWLEFTKHKWGTSSIPADDWRMENDERRQG